MTLTRTRLIWLAVLLLGVTLMVWAAMRGKAGLCLVTVLCTAMIYAQMKTVPRWNHWRTPVLFVGFAATGGAVLAAPAEWAVVLCLALGAVLAAAFRRGDGPLRGRGRRWARPPGWTGWGRLRSSSSPIPAATT